MLASMLASQAALCGFTGRLATGVFQTLSAGNMGQFGAPGSGVPAEAVVGDTATVRPNHITPAATKATGPMILRRRTSAPSQRERPYPTRRRRLARDGRDRSTRARGSGVSAWRRSPGSRTWTPFSIPMRQTGHTAKQPVSATTDDQFLTKPRPMSVRTPVSLAWPASGGAMWVRRGHWRGQVHRGWCGPEARRATEGWAARQSLHRTAPHRTGPHTATQGERRRAASGTAARTEGSGSPQVTSE